MNDLELYTRSWGATAVPFGPLSDTQWVEIPSQQRALTLLNQTAALRGVMLLSGGNGMGKSTLVGRWVRQLESRLFTPVNLTQATLSSSGLLASLARGLGKQPSMRRERNLDDESRPFAMDPAGPRVMLIPGVGIVTCGPDAARARISRDLYQRAISVESAADGIGGFWSP